MLSTLILLVTYGVVIFAAESFAGIGAKGIGLANPGCRPRSRRCTAGT